MTKQNQAANPIKRGVCFILALFLLAGIFTLPNQGYAAQKQYGRITKDKVNFGTSPGDNYVFKLPKDWVVEVLEPVSFDGTLWYKVASENPYARGSSHQGYILDGYFSIMTDDEANAWEQNPVQPVVEGAAQAQSNPSAAQVQPAAALYETFTTGTITNSGTNLREQPWGQVITSLNRGTVLEVFSYAQGNTENDWYGVKYGDKYGYVQAPFFALNTTGVVPTASAPKPTNIPYSENAVGYVKVTKGGSNLRDGINGKTITQLKRNTILPYTAQPTSSGGYRWYPVITAEGKRGYMRSDVVEVVNSDGSSGSDYIPSVPNYTAPPDTSTIYGTVTVTKSNSNLRSSPGGDMIQQIKKGTVLSYYAAPVSAKGYTWYYVQAPDGRYGYLRNDVVSASPSVVIPTQAPGATATIPPTVTAPPSGYGTITLIKGGVNLRRTPNGTSLTQLKKNTTHALTGYPVTSGKYTWYPIQYGSYSGYVRGDMVTYSGSSGGGGGGTVPTTPPTSTTGNYVKITAAAVNLRNAAGGDTIGRVDKYTIWPMTGTAVQTKGFIWYPIRANGLNGYVRGDVAYQMSAQEVQDYLSSGGGVSPTTAPTAAPSTGKYIMMVYDNVPVLDAPTTSGVTLDWFKKDYAIAYNSTVTVSGQVWYNISYRGYSLWIMGSNVRTITAAEYQQWLANNTTPAPTASTAPGTTPTTPSVTADPNTKPEATYKTLRKGSKGEDVKKLQTALKQKGLYSGSIDGVYGSGTFSAVQAYQKSVGLKVDGVAGPNTLHSLYGTVPPGTNPTNPVNPGDTSFALYPVEKSDWVTGDISTVWARGTSAKIKDVRTGYVLTLRRWAGGSHIDAEPLTAFDTQQLCSIYGVSKASQINYKDHWQRRPVWVTVGNRTFAGSLIGVPHNDGDGDTIANNNFDGQLCVHFTNSRTHGSNIVDPNHQDAVNEAYNAYWKSK